QHLAPAICLLVGAAIEGLAAAFGTARGQRRLGLAVTVTLLALALGGAARDVLHPYHMPVHRDLSRLMGAWQHERRADSGIWLMSPLASLPLTVQWYALQGVGGDPARLDSGAAELSRLTGRREWWVLNCDPDREGDPGRPPRAQLAGAGYAI